MHWRAVFVSRVADKAPTDAKEAEKEAAKSQEAKKDDAPAKARLATEAADFLKEAQEARAVTLDGLHFVCPWSDPAESTDAMSTPHSSPSKEERKRVLFDYLDEEIEKDKRDSDSSVYRRLKFMIREMGVLQHDGVDPMTSTLVGEGWVNDSLVALQAIVGGVDTLVVDGSVLTLRKANGV
jgi:hypothetical protein